MKRSPFNNDSPRLRWALTGRSRKIYGMPLKLASEAVRSKTFAAAFKKSTNIYRKSAASDCNALPDFHRSEEWNSNLLARDGVAAAQPPAFVSPPAPPKLSGEVDPTFWEMKSTGVKMLIAAEELSRMPGLEDCDELLLVA